LQVNLWSVCFAGYRALLQNAIGLLCGPAAMFVVGLADAALFGFPLDPLVACYVYRDPHRAALYVLLVSLGSACGATVPYLIGYMGGENVVARRMGERRLRRVRSLTEKYGAPALFIPAILPPPTPFKLFEFSAGLAKMGYRRFLIAVLCGRVLRFSLVALLTRRFGKQVAEVLPALVRLHRRELLAGILLLGVSWLAIKLVVRSRKTVGIPA